MTLHNNFVQKRGVGFYSRVDLFLRDYGNADAICIHVFYIQVTSHAHSNSE